jgi:hypothetical protein
MVGMILDFKTELKTLEQRLKTFVQALQCLFMHETNNPLIKYVLELSGPQMQDQHELNSEHRGSIKFLKTSDEVESFLISRAKILALP